MNWRRGFWASWIAWVALWVGLAAMGTGDLVPVVLIGPPLTVLGLGLLLAWIARGIDRSEGTNTSAHSTGRPTNHPASNGPLRHSEANMLLNRESRINVACPYCVKVFTESIARLQDGAAFTHTCGAAVECDLNELDKFFARRGARPILDLLAPSPMSGARKFVPTT